MVQEGRHACHLLSRSFTPFAGQTVYRRRSSSTVARPGTSSIQPSSSICLIEPYQRAGAQLDLAIAALSDIQHDPVSMEWLVGQRDENLEDRWRHRPLRQQRLRHDVRDYIGIRIYLQVDTTWVCRTLLLPFMMRLQRANVSVTGASASRDLHDTERFTQARLAG